MILNFADRETPVALSFLLLLLASTAFVGGARLPAPRRRLAALGAAALGTAGTAAAVSRSGWGIGLTLSAVATMAFVVALALLLPLLPGRRA